MQTLTYKIQSGIQSMLKINIGKGTGITIYYIFIGSLQSWRWITPILSALPLYRGKRSFQRLTFEEKWKTHLLRQFLMEEMERLIC